MPVPTRRLAAAALALAAARLLLPDDLAGGLLLLDGALLAVATFDWLAAIAPSRIEVQRKSPPVLTIGEESEISWTVSNPSARPVLLSIADELAPSLHAGARRASVLVPARGWATLSTPIRPARRGRFVPSQVVLRTFGPLGLAARQRARSLPAEIQVHPPFRSKQEAELKINKARLLEVGLRSAQGRGAGTEFEQLRDYSPDDEFRRIDWSATARAGKAIVRTYRAERNQTVMVLLDSGRLMAARVEEVPRVEHAMDAALLLATVATRLGDKYGMVTFDGKVRTIIEPSKSRRQVGRVTETVFDLEPALVESDYRGAFTEVVSRYRRRVLIVLLTELNEQASLEFLLPALPLVARSHVVVIGSVRDPEVERWSASPAVDSEAAFRRAAALSALGARASLAARFRSLGVSVVDAGPGRLAPELADTYLKLKATGRL